MEPVNAGACEVRTIRRDGVALGPGAPLLVIAGLCIVEDETTTLRHAEAVAGILAPLGVGAVFKASFDKANRSSLRSFRGPGMAEGLRILAAVKSATGLPILTDIHETSQVAAAAAVADILQIPAFLCRQTDLLLEAGRSGRIVNIKKGQFLAPWDMRHPVDKVISTGNEAVSITERGTSFGYNTLVNDFRALPLMRALGVPVIFDATHSVQVPGGRGHATGGDRSMIPILARAAAAAGIDGLFFEVHEDPSAARSDADNALPLAGLGPVVRDALAIRAALGVPQVR